MSELNPLFISYYTGDEYYKKCSESLKTQCDDIGIDILIDSIESLGFYWKNTLQKPSYILDKIKDLKRDVIWIDIDTQIYKYDKTFKNWNSDILFASFTGDLQGIKASPVGLKYNERSLHFLEMWKESCLNKIRNNDVDLDHDVLKYEVLPCLVGKVSIQLLDDGLDYRNFTNGSIIKNRTSTVSDKWGHMKKVIAKNRFRTQKFNDLSKEDFI